MGEDIEPSLTWNALGAAVQGAVSVRVADDNDVLLTTRSASGTFFCIADNDGITGYDDVDAATVDLCAGTSW
jgi:hypothetical protein